MSRCGTGLLSALLTVVLVLILGLGCGDRGERPSLLLVTVDTLRADALRPYQDASQAGSRSRTPALQRFASEATLFERAVVPMPLTRPSHFSIFTSRHPREHGVVNNQIGLPEREVALAEILHDAGYRTGAVVAVKLLDAGSGAAQGFDQFEAPEDSLEWSAEGVVARARAWLADDAGERPFFLWVHLFDPHQPYDPPADYRGALDPALSRELPSLAWPELTEIARRNDGAIPESVVLHAEALYRAEVEATDHWIGELLGALAAHPRASDTMVVVTADHGECFEDGIYFEHSDCLFEGSLRIPLLVRHAKTFAPGRRHDGLVSSLDIAPTFLELAGLEVPENFSGRPLPREGGTAPGASRHLLIQNPYYQPGVLPARMRRQVAIRKVGGEPVRDIAIDTPIQGVVSQDWKYLRSGDAEELYAIDANGRERRVLTIENRAVRDRLRAELDAALADHPLELIAPAEINPELLQSLRALGYVE